MSEETTTPPDYKNWYHGDLVAELEKRDDRLTSAHATIKRLTENLRIMKSQYNEERDAHLGMITARDIAKKERDAIAAQTHEALKQLTKGTADMPVDYQEQLDCCDKWIQWCKDHGNDWYGVNFHQGMRSGIIHAQHTLAKALARVEETKYDAAIVDWLEAQCFTNREGERQISYDFKGKFRDAARAAMTQAQATPEPTDGLLDNCHGFGAPEDFDED